MERIDVVLSPGEPLPPADVWLVVDILRATTSIVAFFDGGGALLTPLRTVEEALELRKIWGHRWLLAGERGGVPPDGFHRGNSPREMLSGSTGMRLLFTTTNGTEALLRCAATGHPVFAACARNARAAAKEALRRGKRIGIFCAGRHGRSALDDALCAGLLMRRLLEEGVRLEERAPSCGDGAKMALALWRNLGEERFHDVVKEADHAEILRRLGMEEDVRFCCDIDRTDIVPLLGMWKDRPVFSHPRERAG
jgi:2-phosphosulfolactate phosphatase